MGLFQTPTGIPAGQGIADEEEGGFGNWILKTLEFINRPASSVAGFSQGLAVGDLEKAFKFAKKGITGERIYRWSDTLRKLGMSKGEFAELPLLGDITARGVVGFGLDVLTDPLTYMGFFGATKTAKGAKNILDSKSAKSVADSASEFLGTTVAKRDAHLKRALAETDKEFAKDFAETLPGKFKSSAPEGHRQVFIDTNKLDNFAGIDNPKLNKRIEKEFNAFNDPENLTSKLTPGVASLTEEGALKFASQQEGLLSKTMRERGIRRQALNVPESQADDIIERFGFTHFEASPIGKTSDELAEEVARLTFGGSHLAEAEAVDALKFAFSGNPAKGRKIIQKAATKIADEIEDSAAFLRGKKGVKLTVAEKASEAATRENIINQWVKLYDNAVAEHSVTSTGGIPLNAAGTVIETRGRNDAGQIIQRSTINPVHAVKVRSAAQKKAQDSFEIVFQQDKAAWVNSIDEASKGSVETIINSGRILDRATDSNINAADILRLLADEDPRFIGSTMASQAHKGQRTIFQFAGRSTKEIAEAFGVPQSFTRKQLRIADEAMFKFLGAAGGKIREWPIIRQSLDLLSLKTGDSFINNFIGRMRMATQGSAFSAMHKSFRIMGKQMDLLGVDPVRQKEMMREVVELVEADNINNMITPLAKSADPKVNEFVGFLKAQMQKMTTREINALSEIGLELRTLNGYFPRELTPRFKQHLEEAIIASNSPGTAKLLQGALKHRQGSFADLSTNQINDLMASNNLVFLDLQNYAKTNPKWLKKLQKEDPGLADFFVDDPALAFASRLAAGERAVTLMEQTGSFLKMFGRRVDSKASARNANEAIVIPSGLVGRFPQPIVDSDRAVSAVQKALPGIDPNSIGSTTDAYHKLSLEEIINVAGRESLTDTTTGQAAKLFQELPYADIHTFSMLEELGVPMYVVDKKLMGLMNEAVSYSTDPGFIRDSFRGFDAAQTLWKRLTTSIFPAFWTRNLISDMFWQSRLAGIATIKEMSLDNGAYAAAAKHLNGTHLNPFRGRKSLAGTDDLSSMGHELIGDAGEVFDTAEEFRRFVELGGTGGAIRDLEPSVTTGKVTNSIRDELATGVQKAKLAADIRKPSFLPVKGMSALGEYSNQVSRFGHYLAKRKAGFSAEEAMMNVKTFLFDYSELTTFERKYLKRVFPFYTWMRKNIPLQLQMMIQQPGKFANLEKARRAVTDTKLEASLPAGGIPEFVKREYGITTRRVDDDTVEFFLLGSWVPAADLLSIGEGGAFGREIISSISPFLKAPFELITNTNFFNEAPINQFPGDKGTFLNMNMDKNTIHVLRNMRALTTVDKLIGKEDANDPLRRKRYNVGEKFIEHFVGIKAVQADPEKVAGRLQREKNRQISAIKRSEERATDPDQKQYFHDLLEEAEALSLLKNK